MIFIFSYPSILSLVLGAQKKRLIETVLLSTHNIVLVEKNTLIRSLIRIYMGQHMRLYLLQCQQQRLRRACVYAQTHQSLYCSQTQSMDASEGVDQNLDL